MGIGDIFGYTFYIVKNNPRVILPYLICTILVGSIVLYLVLGGLETIYGPSLFSMPQMQAPFSGAQAMQFYEGVLPVLILILLIPLFIASLLVGIYVSVADQGYRKKGISLSAAFQVAKSNYVNLLFTSLLVVIIWIIVISIMAAIFLLPIIVIGAGLGTVLWLALGALVFLAVVILLSILLYEAFTVVILENLGAISAVKRSIEIGKRNMSTIFFVFVIGAVITIGYAIVIGLLAVGIEGAFALAHQLIFGIVISQAINFILASGMSAWLAMIPVGFYRTYVQKASKAKAKK